MRRFQEAHSGSNRLPRKGKSRMAPNMKRWQKRCYTLVEYAGVKRCSVIRGPVSETVQ